MAISDRVVKLWFLFPLIPIAVHSVYLTWFVSFEPDAWGGTCSCSNCRVMGKLVEKANLARTTRTLGALVASGVPIIEGLTITRETSGNAMYRKGLQQSDRFDSRR